MPEPTLCNSLPDVLVSLSPALSGLLSAIALWVASRARTTSRDAQQTSQANLTLSLLPSDSPREHVWDDAARGRKRRSSTTAAEGDTYTSPGEEDLED